MGEVSFIEIGAGDSEKARAFYGGLFPEWKFETGPSGGGWVIDTGGVPGGVHTGDAGAAMYAFIAVEDLDAAMEKVVELGGEAKTLDDSEENQAAFGRFAMCKDDQGSAFGLHQRPPR